MISFEFPHYLNEKSLNPIAAGGVQHIMSCAIENAGTEPKASFGKGAFSSLKYSTPHKKWGNSKPQWQWTITNFGLDKPWQVL